MYNEHQQDLFEGESVLAAANKVFDFKKFQQNQSQKPENHKGKQLNNTETIDYADDLNLDDVLEKKNLKIAAKQISDKYRKLRNRKAAISEPKLHKISKSIVKPDKKGKKTIDKRLIEAVKKIKRNTRISMENDFSKAKKTFEKLKLDPSSAASMQQTRNFLML